MKDTLNQLKKALRGEWRYKGETNSSMNKHTWTNGSETVDIFYMNGAGSHAGYVVDVTGEESDETLTLTNGFVESIRAAMILADLHIRDDSISPAAFMLSDRVESDCVPGELVRQDEWLRAHAHDYEFAVIEPRNIE